MLGSHPLVSSPATSGTAAAQEPLADQRLAPATAPVAVRRRPPGPLIRGRCVARDLRRAERQQIIRLRRGGTVMRHGLAASAGAACPGGMGEPPAAAALVSPPGVALGTVPGPRSAGPGAVNLTTIATAANQHLGATACAEKQPGGRSLSVCGSADARWTAAAIAGILALHSCPARCEARRRCRTCRLGSAPCLPSIPARS